MSAVHERLVRMTEAEYLAFERASETRHEFIDGEIVDMSGASRSHNLIALHAATSLVSQLLDRPCETYKSDMRVKAASGNSYMYPDVVVVCGDIQVEDDRGDTMLNPTLIIEVLSPSTEGYDRGKKFINYRELASLREYLLVSQDKPYIERYVRQDDESWVLTGAKGMDASVDLTSIGCILRLADVYARVTFPSASEADADAPTQE